jgi:hypothetical protein
MPKGRKAGFHHSEATKEKMRGKRNKEIKKEVNESIKEQETPLISA